MLTCSVLVSRSGQNQPGCMAKQRFRDLSMQCPRLDLSKRCLVMRSQAPALASCWLEQMHVCMQMAQTRSTANVDNSKVGMDASAAPALSFEATEPEDLDKVPRSCKCHALPMPAHACNALPTARERAPRPLLLM